MVDTNEDLKTMAKGEEGEEGEGKKTKRGRKKKGGDREEVEREGKRRKSG